MSEIPDKASMAPEINSAQQPAAAPEQPAVIRKVGEPFEIAVLSLQNTTLFPETVVPLAVGRPRSVAAVEAALATEEKLLACITVRADATNTTQDAGTDDLYQVGTLTMIKRMERMGETMHIIVQGTDRIKVIEWKQQEPFLRAVVQILPEVQVKDPEEVEATKRNVQAMVQEALALLPNVPPEVRVAMLGSVEPVRLARTVDQLARSGAAA